jgi:hypothetical protein
MMLNYAACHEVEDLIHFANFLLKKTILTKFEVVDFLTQDDLIPSPAIGVFRIETLRAMLPKLSYAATL